MKRSHLGALALLGSLSAILAGATLVADAASQPDGMASKLVILDRVPTSDEYTDATNRVVACLKAGGLDVMGPVMDNTGRWVYASGDPTGLLDPDAVRQKCLTPEIESVVATYQLSLPSSDKEAPVELVPSG